MPSRRNAWASFFVLVAFHGAALHLISQDTRDRCLFGVDVMTQQGCTIDQKKSKFVVLIHTFSNPIAEWRQICHFFPFGTSAA